MATKKRSKPHSSARKRTAASTVESARKKTAKPAASSARAKKAASKHSQSAAKSKKPKKRAERPAWEKRAELTLKMFQMVYEDYQQGKFQRIL